MSTLPFEQARSLASDLTPRDKLRLIDDLVQQLLREPAMQNRGPFRSLWGALAHLGPAPSAEEIDEARREAWANFPREDI
jgi:hypothetical protein